MKRKLFIIIFFLVLLIAILNEVAINFFLYWKFWWFDIMMHFLGGLWVGFSSLWFYYLTKEDKVKRESFLFALWVSFVGIVLIGLGWEVFEFFIKINMSDKYIYDTSLDIFMDMIGAFVATVLFFNFYKKKKSLK